MGVGNHWRDLFAVVEKGIDMFDCVSPTRIARNGTLFVHPSVDKAGKIDITSGKFKDDKNPIDNYYQNPALANYSRAYLHHLFKTEEMLAYRLATMHNLYFLTSLMTDMRSAINADKFVEFKKKWYS